MCHPTAVVFVGVDASFSPHVPDLHAGVQGARCKEFAEWVEIYAETTGAVASQGSDNCKYFATLLS